MQQADEYAAYVPPDAEDVTHRAQDCDCEQYALGRASSVPSADVWREEPAMNVRAERPRAGRGKEGNLKAERALPKPSAFYGEQRHNGR